MDAQPSVVALQQRADLPDQRAPVPVQNLVAHRVLQLEVAPSVLKEPVLVGGQEFHGHGRAQDRPLGWSVHNPHLYQPPVRLLSCFFCSTPPRP